MLTVKNKSKRLNEEVRDLEKQNPELLLLMMDLSNWVESQFDKDLTITMIYRTSDEQDAIYGNSERYQKRKFKSPHQFYHAIDIRSYTFDDDEISQIEEYLNDKHDELNYYRWTAKCHEVGNWGKHFHIQYVKK